MASRKGKKHGDIVGRLYGVEVRAARKPKSGKVWIYIQADEGSTFRVYENLSYRNRVHICLEPEKKTK